MIKLINIVFFIVSCLFQTLVCAEWNDITNRVSFNKSSQAFDRVNRVLYSLVTIHNTSGTDLSGPLRLRAFDSSVPFANPSTTNGNESFLEIPEGLIVNESRVLRVDFELAKQLLTYSLALEFDSRILHVTTTGSDEAGDGTEASPFATIQHAINQANYYDMVIVHDGRYDENINFMGKAITVGSQILLDSNTDHIVDTIIDGGRRDSVVKFESCENSSSRLIGLSITNGYANGDSYISRSGGGIRVFDSSPRLEQLDVYENEAQTHGGGISFDGNDCVHEALVITQSTVIHNRSGATGGGVSFRSDRQKNANIISSAIIGNHASDLGGGLFFYHVGKVEDSIVVGNDSNVGGGAYVDWGTYSGPLDVQFTNTTIAGNYAQSYGGGLTYIIQGGRYTNSIVWGNFPDNLRRDPRFWDSGIIFNFSLISPLQPGPGNLDTDPLFIANPNPGPDAIWGTTDDSHGDLRLQADSPVIDQGDSAAITLPTDYQGADRIQGDAVDFGAYEWHP